MNLPTSLQEIEATLALVVAQPVASGGCTAWEPCSAQEGNEEKEISSPRQFLQA